MRKSLLLTSFLGTAILAGGLGAAANSEHGPMHRFGESPFGRLIMARMGRAMTLRAELDLTDAQRDAIRDTLKADKQELAAALKPAVDAHRVLRDAVLADKTDDTAIRKAADDLGKKIGDAAVEIAKVKTEIASKANLTSEQMKKINDFRAANDASVDEFFDKIQNAK